MKIGKKVIVSRILKWLELNDFEPFVPLALNV